MFDRNKIERASCDWSDAQKINEAVAKLEKVRVPVLTVAGNEVFERSKLAWKLAVLSQSLAYRLYDLANAAIAAWCEGNDLAAMVLARAAFETCALVEYVAQELGPLVDREDLAGIDQLLMQHTFATRQEAWLQEDNFPRAINILTAVGRLDRTIPGAAGHYERISEFAHPNSMGAHQFYATTDHETAEVKFSRQKRSGKGTFLLLVAALGTIKWIIKRLDDLEAHTIRVSEIQHRLAPVRSV